MTVKLRDLTVQSSLTGRLASGHPWIYRDHVPRGFSAPAGTWVRVKAGNFEGVGLWDDESSIAIRMFSRGSIPNPAWVRERVRDAWDLRAPLRASGVNGYRLIYGEGDRLPGLVVDLYEGYCVLVTYSKSLEPLVAPVTAALAEVARPRGIVRRRGPGALELLFGKLPPADLTVSEHGGMRLAVDVAQGQKTGLFLDHRENRHWVRAQAADARVLNLFSYTGGFSVSAALGGARHVTSVDVAGPAVAAAKRNFALNGLEQFPHEAVSEDAFSYLDRSVEAGRRFDLVVCDPPSFAKNRSQLKAAEKAYRRLTALGLRVTEPGGLYAAASCTSQVGPEAFRAAIADASRKARVHFQIIHDIGHPLDHPVLASHPEGRYLKFVVGRVLPQS